MAEKVYDGAMNSGRPGKGGRIALLERRNKIAALYARGKTQAAIAAELKVTQNAVSLDLKAIRKMWVAETVEAFAERQAVELAKVDEVIREAWSAWEKSKEDARKHLVKTVTGSGEDGSEQVTKQAQTEAQVGDARYLDIIMRGLTQRHKLLGLDQTSKINILNNNGGSNAHNDTKVPSIGDILRQLAGPRDSEVIAATMFTIPEGYALPENAPETTVIADKIAEDADRIEDDFGASMNGHHQNGTLHHDEGAPEDDDE